MAAVLAAQSAWNGRANHEALDGYHFTTQHSVPIEEARQRLLAVHARTWQEVHQQYHAKQIQWNQSFYTPAKPRSPNIRNMESSLIPIAPIPDRPPLIRLVIDGVNLQIGGPSFSMEELPDFLFDIGRNRLTTPAPAPQVTPQEYQGKLIVPHHSVYLTNRLSEINLVTIEMFSTSVQHERSRQSQHLPHHNTQVHRLVDKRRRSTRRSGTST